VNAVAYLIEISNQSPNSKTMNTITQQQFIGSQTHRSGLPAFLLPAPQLATPQEFRGAPSVKNTGPAEWPSDAETSALTYPRGDTFQLYLREIGQVRLLEPEEEIELAERIKQGDLEAREQMIKANLRLVVKIAREYEGLGLPLLDLISEGNIGLMKGVERFRPGKGAKLSTYASWWIKQAIKQALANQSKTIRLPVHVAHTVAHIRKAEVRLRETLDRAATDVEVADDLDLTPQRVRQYREASRAPVCFDAPIGNDDLTPISELLADESAAAPFDELAKDTETDLVHKVMATLNARESKILAMRFGLDDDRSKTLEEISEHFGVSRERVRQIQEQALEKMRVRIEKRDRKSLAGCLG
jgi:RNA polymerase primary sigma factor